MLQISLLKTLTNMTKNDTFSPYTLTNYNCFLCILVT